MNEYELELWSEDEFVGLDYIDESLLDSLVSHYAEKGYYININLKGDSDEPLFQ